MGDENIDNNLDDGGNNKTVLADDLKPSDPKHPDYDPLKDAKVRAKTDALYSAIASEQEKAKKIEEEMEKLKVKIKSQEDKEKSEMERLQESIKNLESERNQLHNNVDEGKKAISSLTAKFLTQQAVIDRRINVSKLEMRGLIVEVQDALKSKLETEGDEEVVTRVVGEFAKDKQENDDDNKANNLKSKVKNPPAPKENNSNPQEPDLHKKLKELNKDPSKNEKEIMNILKKLDNRLTKKA